MENTYQFIRTYDSDPRPQVDWVKAPDLELAMKIMIKHEIQQIKGVLGLEITEEQAMEVLAKRIYRIFEISNGVILEVTPYPEGFHPSGLHFFNDVKALRHG